jgi:uncharacterized phage protein gp47/JayE
MITKVNSTISNLKNLWIEIFQNKTNKATNIADGSVVNATAFATAKVAQKAIKDIAIVEAQIFPENATGEYLDRAAVLFGVSPRKGALGSSTYVRVYAEPGTEYGLDTVFINKNGIRFEVDTPLVVDDSGYGYVSVRSTIVGSVTNVDANSITQVIPRPLSHIDCTNEYQAVGGRDEEDDDTFRARIINNNNKLSQTTLEYWTQIFQDLDPRVLKVMNVGLGENAKIYIYLITQNGSFFTDEELDVLLQKATPYLSLSDINVQGNALGVELKNAEWKYVGGDVGIDFRIELSAEYNVATVRKNIQVALTKYLDFRFWTPGKSIQWDDLLSIVKTATGVKYVPDEYFYPSFDEEVPLNQLPRIRGFRMRDLNGNILYDSGQTLSNLFYPAIKEDIYKGNQSQVLTRTQYVYFTVTTTRNSIVEGAVINVGDKILITDENGQAFIKLENGEYNYVLTKLNWNSKEGSFIVLNAAVYITINDFSAVQHSLNFTVLQGTLPAEDVEININNQVLNTDENGHVSIKLEPGSYSYTIKKEGYIQISNAVTIGIEDVDITEYIFPEPQVVNISVIDSKNNIFVPTAKVLIQDLIEDTDENGQLRLNLTEGTYNTIVKKEGYIDYDDQIKIKVQDRNNILIDLNPMPYIVTFTVLEGGTNKPIKGAVVTIDGQNYSTDSNGNAVASIPNGTHEYSINYSGYTPVTGSIVVDNGNVSRVVYLSLAYWNIKLIVKDSLTGSFVNNAKVFINNQSYYTDINGEVDFVLSNGTYQYTITQNDYRTTSGSIDVLDEDIERVVFATPKARKVSLIIKDERTQVLLVGATAVLKDKGTGVVIGNTTSNSLGVALFDDIEEGEYTYEVSFPDYEDSSGEILVEKKDVEQIVLMSLKPRDINYNIKEKDDSLESAVNSSGASISVKDLFTSQVVSGTTDSQGNFQAKGVIGSDYEITYSKYGVSKVETITIGISTVNVDLVLEATDTATFKRFYKNNLFNLPISVGNLFFGDIDFGQVSSINVKVFLSKEYNLTTEETNYFPAQTFLKTVNTAGEIVNIEVEPYLPDVTLNVTISSGFFITSNNEYLITSDGLNFKTAATPRSYTYKVTSDANEYHPAFSYEGQSDDGSPVVLNLPSYSRVTVTVNSKKYLEFSEEFEIDSKVSKILNIRLSEQPPIPIVSENGLKNITSEDNINLISEKI